MWGGAITLIYRQMELFEVNCSNWIAYLFYYRANITSQIISNLIANISYVPSKQSFCMTQTNWLASKQILRLLTPWPNVEWEFKIIPQKLQNLILTIISQKCEPQISPMLRTPQLSEKKQKPHSFTFITFAKRHYKYLRMLLNDFQSLINIYKFPKKRHLQKNNIKYIS